MQKTKYSNSHGLSNPDNRSCCFDLGILCEYAMNNTKFRDIVGRKVYEGQIKIDTQEAIGVGVTKESSYSRKALKVKKNKSIEDVINEKDMEMAQMKDLDDIIIQQTAVEEDYQVSSIKHPRTYRNIRWQNTHQLVQTKS